MRRSPLPAFLSRRLAVVLGLAAAATLSAATPGAADLQSQITAARTASAGVAAAVAADSAQIAATGGNLRSAQAHLSALQAALRAREAALRTTRRDLLAARNHLVDLENRLRVASETLSANLVARYENGSPNLMTVILQAHGFNTLLEQLSFLRRVSDQDARIIAFTRVARTEVTRQVKHLAVLEARDRTLTHQVLGERNQVAAWDAALVTRQIAELHTRANDASRLGDLRAHLHTLEARAAAQAAAAARAAAQARAAAAANAHSAAAPSTSAAPASSAGLATDSGGMVQAPPGAPAQVAEVIAAANAIATMPYVYGGGHASFHADGYDCSGSVSYALAAAGLLSAPLDSTGFESYGDPGPGRWITIYANAGHAWMEVAGWRFDTVAQSENGTRWAQGGGEFAGMVERHPPGL